MKEYAVMQKTVLGSYMVFIHQANGSCSPLVFSEMYEANRAVAEINRRGQDNRVKK